MIEIKNLTYQYKEGNVGLKDINLTFSKGEIVMIIGSNGSGKSTLLSSIANLNKYQGLITLDGVDIKKIKNVDFRKKVGIVFQNPNNQIIFNKVYDDIKFTLENLKVDKVDERIHTALSLVGMLKHLNSNPYNLSMGEKQRIALASALCVDKDYLLLDEVTSMIDYNGKQEIYRIINRLKAKKMGIIMSTNIVDELLFADRVVIINEDHTIKGVYSKKDIFNNVDLLSDFYIPLKIKIIHKIGYDKLKSLTDEELIKYVNK